MDEIRVELEPGSLRKLVQASRTWDKKSRAEMRANLRTAASKGADAVRADVLGNPPPRLRAGGRRRSSGLRAGLSAGVKVTIRSGRESASGGVTGEGVRVSTTAGALPAGKAPMVKAYMAGSFRHPVFGGPGWADQRGRNWFYKPLRAGRESYKSAVVAAVEAASEAIAND